MRYISCIIVCHLYSHNTIFLFQGSHLVKEGPEVAFFTKHFRIVPIQGRISRLILYITLCHFSRAHIWSRSDQKGHSLLNTSEYYLYNEEFVHFLYHGLSLVFKHCNFPIPGLTFGQRGTRRVILYLTLQNSIA